MVDEETDQRQRLLFKVMPADTGGLAEVGNEGNNLFSCLFVTSERFAAVTRTDDFVNRT